MAIAIRELGLTLRDFEVYFKAEKARPLCSGSMMGDDAMIPLSWCPEELPILLCDED
jgi:hypothetical protein